MKLIIIALLASSVASAKIEKDRDGHYNAYCKGQSTPFATYLTEADAKAGIAKECPAGGIIMHNGLKIEVPIKKK